MNRDDALIAVIEAGTSILLGAEPVVNKPGLSTIQDNRIKRLADAITNLREVLGFNK